MSMRQLALVAAAMGGLLILCACEGQKDRPAESAAAARTDSADDAAASDSHDHSHAHHLESTRGGQIIALDDHVAHLEITVERETGRISLYVMDCDGRAIRIRQEEIEIAFTPPAPEPDFTLPLLAVADTLTGETKGDTSAFSARCDELERLTGFEAVIKEIVIRGSIVKNVRFTWPKP
jgi:hypothetical protein